MTRLVFGIVFLAVGVYVLGWGVRNLEAAKASAKWPSVDGVVVATRVEPRRSRQHNRTRIRYVARIEYRYNVDGKNYTSSHVSFGGRKMHTTQAAAEKELDAYPVGKKVTVFYDPAVPNSSVLLRGVTGSVYLVFAAGALFIILGTFAAVFGKSVRRRIAI